MSTTNAVRKAIQMLHREWLHGAMQVGDTKYATATNAIMDLMNRLEDDGVRET